MKLKFRLTLKADPENTTIQDGKKLILAQEDIILKTSDVSSDEVLITKKLLDLKDELIQKHIEVEIKSLT